MSLADCVVAVTPSANTDVAVTLPVKSPVTFPVTLTVIELGNPIVSV